MIEYINRVLLMFLMVLSLLAFLFTLWYLMKSFHDEFQKKRILTLYYQRSSFGLTRGISASGMIHFGYNLRFEEQIIYLCNQGYQTVSMEDLIASRERRQSLPQKPLLIILDHGYWSNYFHICPIIKKFGLSATMFVTPNPKSEAFAQLEGIDLPITNRQIREISGENIAIGSHGMTSNSLANPSEKNLYEELKESKAALESILGQKVDCLAVPQGIFLDRQTQSIIQQVGYKIAIGNRVGTNNIRSNFLNLRKLVVSRDMDLEEFKKFLNPMKIYQQRILSDVKGIPFQIADFFRSLRRKNSPFLPSGNPEDTG
jgi:peptidoglycan/xylan/chitin deacetylase (PgdA/CDA1 family)